jgi:hypothetical protein
VAFGEVPVSTPRSMIRLDFGLPILASVAPVTRGIGIRKIKGFLMVSEVRRERIPQLKEK